jgi:DNA-binding NarL/FixJ family response regulator
MIKVAIADDEALFRKGMGLLIDDFEGIEFMLEAGNGQELLDNLAAAEKMPAIVLLDLNMPVLNGIDTAKILKEKHPELRIIILSTYFSKAFIINMIEIGAASYLPKNTSPEEVEKTIREVADKGFSYNQAVMEIIRDNMIQKTKPKINMPFQIDLTTREREVLQLICEQYKTAEIGEKLFISPRTVDGHRNKLLEKVGCRNTAGLVVFAIQHNLVKINPEPTWF